MGWLVAYGKSEGVPPQLQPGSWTIVDGHCADTLTSASLKADQNEFSKIVRKDAITIIVLIVVALMDGQSG